MHKQNSLLDCCANKKFEIIRGDICDYDKLNPISIFDIIIPLAALVGAPACKPISSTACKLWFIY